MARIDGVAGARSLNAMKEAERALQTSLERMGKASRINSAADDASGMVIRPLLKLTTHNYPSSLYSDIYSLGL